MGIIVGLLISLPIGVYAAIRQDTITDYILRSIAILLISIPSFWLGTLVVLYASSGGAGRRRWSLFPCLKTCREPGDDDRSGPGFRRGANRRNDENDPDDDA